MQEGDDSIDEEMRERRIEREIDKKELVLSLCVCFMCGDDTEVEGRAGFYISLFLLQLSSAVQELLIQSVHFFFYSGMPLDTILPRKGFILTTILYFSIVFLNFIL